MAGLLHTRMCHVQQRPGRVPLHPHVPGLSEACKRPEGPRPSNLRLVGFVCGQVGDAAHRVALNLDIGR